MIQTKTLIPEVYSQSYDMSVFTGLLDLIYTARELDALRAKESHSPQDCFEEDLPRLASLFGLPTSSSRQLISDYRRLVQHKGTWSAITSAIAFAASLIPHKNQVKVYKDTTTNTFTAYINFTTLDETILETLLRKLAPVSLQLIVKPIEELPPDVLSANLVFG